MYRFILRVESDFAIQLYSEFALNRFKAAEFSCDNLNVKLYTLPKTIPPLVKLSSEQKAAEVRQLMSECIPESDWLQNGSY